ncbi:hypothetical protein ACU4GD_03585 [Cupriavidus basilensis]
MKRRAGSDHVPPCPARRTRPPQSSAHKAPLPPRARAPASLLRACDAGRSRESVVRDILAEKKHLRGLAQAMDGVAVFGRADQRPTRLPLALMRARRSRRLRGATRRVSSSAAAETEAERPCRAGMASCDVTSCAAPAPGPSRRRVRQALSSLDMAVSPAYEVRIVHAASGGGLVPVLRDVTSQAAPRPA